jgi:hypothetical protein
MTDVWKPGYPACASTPEDDGPNFISPTMGNTIAPFNRRLREAAVFSKVSRETADFHERKARKYGLDNPTGLAHFKAAKTYRQQESAGRLQEMFENGGEIGELPPKAIMKVNKAAMAFHKKQAGKAGLDSDEGHAHVAALEHHMDIYNKAKQHHQASKQQQPQQMQTAAPGHGGKQAPIPVPHKSDQPSEDIRQDLPPVPLRKLQQQRRETAGAHAGMIRAGGPGSGPHGHSATGQAAGRFLTKELHKRGMSHRDVPELTSYKKESREAGGRGPHMDMDCTEPRHVKKQLSDDRIFRGKRLKPPTRGPLAGAARANYSGGLKKREAGRQQMVAPRYDKSHPEGYVDSRYSGMKNGINESKRTKRSLESRRGNRDLDGGAPQLIDLQSFYKKPEVVEGWRNGAYTPPVSRIQKLTQKEAVVRESWDGVSPY